MRGKNRRFWVFLVSALLLVLTFVGYRYITRDQQVVVPVDPAHSTEEPIVVAPSDDQVVEEMEEIRVGVVDLELLRHSHPKIKQLDQLEDQIRGYMQELSQQQSELMTNKKQVENQYASLNSQLEEQVKGIQDKYQQKIDAKVVELQEELTRLEEAIWKEKMADVERKLEDIKALGLEAIEAYYAKQMQKLEEAKNEISTQYSPEILNLRLKLQMVQLSEEEQKKYKDRLEKIQAEQDQKIQELQVQLDEEIKKYYDEKQIELDEEIKAYQEQAQKDAEALFRVKQNDLDNVLQAYIKQMESEMQAEISGKQKRLEEQTENGLTQAQRQIDQEIAKNDKLLKTKIEDARKKQEGILQQIDEDIKMITGKLAKEKNLDVILTDVRVNVQAQDVTDQVLKKLNQ